MFSESELNLGAVLNVDFRSSRESSRSSYAQWSLLGAELSVLAVLEVRDRLLLKTFWPLSALSYAVGCSVDLSICMIDC